MNQKTLYSFFFVILLVTEFYHIEIWGGVARIYHFLAVLVVLSLFKFIRRLFKSSVFRALMAFVGVNLLAVSLSNEPAAAMVSFLSLAANLSIAMATALILLAGKVDLASFKRLILRITLASVFWGILQIAAFRFFRIDLSLSPEQATQLPLGFGPAFRTEANAFGKYMIIPFLFFLPEYIRNRQAEKLALIYSVFVVGILMNFTRTSIYGLGLTAFFILGWHVLHANLGVLVKKWIIFSSVASVFIILFASGLFGADSYAFYKIYNLFNHEEMLTGGSSGFRLLSMENMLNSFLSSGKTILIGNGWGQVYMDYGGDFYQSGGGDLLVTLGYGGAFGGATYLLYMLFTFLSAKKVATSRLDTQTTQFAEGIMFVFVGIFCTGQMAGYLIAPEYWLFIGVGICLSAKKRHHCYSYANLAGDRTRICTGF